MVLPARCCRLRPGPAAAGAPCAQQPSRSPPGPFLGPIQPAPDAGGPGTGGPGSAGAVTNGGRGRDWVALTLAIGIATAINIIVFAVLWDAIYSSDSGLSENATQVLTAAFGGIIGVLGSYVGFKAAEIRQSNEHSIDPITPPDVERQQEATDTD